MANKNAKITISSVAKGITSLEPTFPKQSATVQVRGADVRFTTDGTLPVAGSDGLVAVDGSTILLENKKEINDFRAIREAAVDAVLQIAFEDRKKHATNFTDTPA